MTDADDVRTLSGKAVLVTGGSGFLGAHLIDRLTSCGCAVHSTSRQARHAPGVRWYRADVSDAESVRTIMRECRPEIVFHLASPPDAPPQLPGDDAPMHQIVMGTYHVLAAARQFGCRSVVLAGSAKEYGPRRDLSPGQTYLFREGDPAFPATAYALGKLTATLMGQMYSRAFDMPIVCLRLFSIYGPGMTGRSLVGDAVRGAIADERILMTRGEQQRDFLYVSDAVEALVRAALSPEGAGAVMNVCSGRAVQVRELVTLIYALAGSRVKPDLGGLPYRNEEIWSLCGDPALAEKLLGFRSAVSIEEGLKATIGWWRAQGAG